MFIVVVRLCLKCVTIVSGARVCAAGNIDNRSDFQEGARWTGLSLVALEYYVGIGCPKDGRQFGTLDAVTRGVKWPRLGVFFGQILLSALFQRIVCDELLASM